MAYTGHGHHIPDTNKGQGVTKAPAPIRCGGLELCPRCQQDAKEYWASVTGTPEDFQAKAKRIVREYMERESAGLGIPLPPFDLYVPWFAKILMGWKATVGSTIPDNRYYEVTYDANRRQTYLDVYNKVDNVVIPDRY